MLKFKTLFEDDRFVNKMFNDIKIFMKPPVYTSLIPRLLVTNDHQFYREIMKSSEFQKVLWVTVGNHLEVIPCQVILAQEIIDGMP